MLRAVTSCSTECWLCGWLVQLRFPRPHRLCTSMSIRLFGRFARSDFQGYNVVVTGVHSCSCKIEETQALRKLLHNFSIKRRRHVLMFYHFVSPIHASCYLPDVLNRQTLSSRGRQYMPRRKGFDPNRRVLHLRLLVLRGYRDTLAGHGVRPAGALRALAW